MGVDRRHIDSTVGDDRRGQASSDIGCPTHADICGNFGFRAAAASVAATIGRPISRICDLRLPIFDLCESRAFLQTCVFRRDRYRLAFRRGRCQGVEPEQFDLRIAGTVAGRRIDQSVARHDAVQTAATDPVVDRPVLVGRIEDFDTGARHQQKVVGGFAAITAVVEPIGLHVRCELDLHLARLRVTPGEHTVVPAAGRLTGPNQPAGNQDVLGGHVSALWMIGRPADLSGFGVHRSHRIFATAMRHHLLAAREQHDVVVQDQRRCEEGLHLRPAAHRLLPQFVAGFSIKTYDRFAVVVIDTFRIGGQSRRHHNRLALPEHLARFGIDGHDAPRIQIEGDTAVVIPRRLDRLEFNLVLRTIHLQKQGAIVVHDFFGRRRFLVSLKRAPRRGVDFLQGCVDRRRKEHLVANRHQTSWQIAGTALQRVMVREPTTHRLGPQGRTVERVASHQVPVGGDLDGPARAHVDDIEHLRPVADHGTDAGHVVMMTRVSRSARPLQSPRYVDHLVVGHGVVRRVVQEVRPDVDLVRARLNHLSPAAFASQEGDAIRTQDAQDLRVAHLIRLCDEQCVDHVVDQR